MKNTMDIDFEKLMKKAATDKSDAEFEKFLKEKSLSEKSQQTLLDICSVYAGKQLNNNEECNAFLSTLSKSTREEIRMIYFDEEMYDQDSLFKYSHMSQPYSILRTDIKGSPYNNLFSCIPVQRSNRSFFGMILMKDRFQGFC